MNPKYLMFSKNINPRIYILHLCYNGQVLAKKNSYVKDSNICGKTIKKGKGLMNTKLRKLRKC